MNELSYPLVTLYLFHKRIVNISPAIKNDIDIGESKKYNE